MSQTESGASVHRPARMPTWQRILIAVLVVTGICLFFVAAANLSSGWLAFEGDRARQEAIQRQNQQVEAEVRDEVIHHYKAD